MTNKEIIFGAVYKLQKGANKLLKSVKGGMHGEYFAFQNDQAYYYFLPINANVNGGVKTYMVDTYMIDKPSYKNYEDLITIIKSWADPEKGSRIRSRCYDYYYSGIFELTEKTFPAFELYCDLSKVDPVDSNKAEKLLAEDVFWHIPLYHEHNYSWGTGTEGITLATKNASPDAERSLRAVVNKIINLKINDTYYNDVYNDLQNVKNNFPKLYEEHQEEINAADSYMRMLDSFQQLMLFSLGPYKDVLNDFLYERTKEMVVKTEAGEIIAKESKSDNKGISLSFKPKKSNTVEPLAIAECHADIGNKVADETPDDVFMYTYTDAFDEPVKHVRSSKAITQHEVNLSTVRALEEGKDWDRVDNMDTDSTFHVVDLVDCPDSAYGIFKRTGSMIGYCTLGGADVVLPKCITEDEHYDKDSLYLSDVYITPAERCKGYALKMIREAIKQKWDAERKACSVYLTVLNDEIAKLYEQLGFKWLTPREEGCMVLDPKEFR